MQQKYFSDINRQIAESMLASHDEACYLIRNSSYDNALALSYKDSTGGIAHYLFELNENNCNLHWRSVKTPSEKQIAFTTDIIATHIDSLIDSFPESVKKTKMITPEPEHILDKTEAQKYTLEEKKEPSIS